MLNLVGTNQRGCPVYNFLKIAEDGSKVDGTSSESLAGKCDYSPSD